MRARTALRQASVESRFDALHASGLTELVGREEELEILLRRWSKAKTGEGQVVLLSGEPGIGKSRLTAALLERIASEPHTRLRYFCSPQPWQPNPGRRSTYRCGKSVQTTGATSERIRISVLKPAKDKARYCVN